MNIDVKGEILEFVWNEPYTTKINIWTSLHNIVSRCKKDISLWGAVSQFPGNTNVMVQHIFENSNRDDEDGDQPVWGRNYND